MRRRLLMKFAVWLAVASSSVTMIGPAGIVLCVSASGHVEIETGGDDCCGDAHAAARDLTHAERCECVDTPVLRVAGGRSSIGTERLLSGWFAQPLSLFEPPRVYHLAFVIPANLMTADRFRESTDLASLRSVVLLA